SRPAHTPTYTPADHSSRPHASLPQLPPTRPPAHTPDGSGISSANFDTGTGNSTPPFREHVQTCEYSSPSPLQIYMPCLQDRRMKLLFHGEFMPSTKETLRHFYQDQYPHVAMYELHIEGKPLVLHLERNEDLIADNYKETSYHQDGTPIMRSPNKNIKDHCHYQGYVENDSQSVASISTCSGISGVIMTQGRRFLIEPLTSEEHVVYEEKEPPKTCGTLSEPWEEFLLAQEVLPALDNKEEIDKLQNSWKYIEMYMVADKSLFEKYKQNATAVKNRIYEVTNYMNMVFKAINVSVVLVGLEIWETKNQMEVNSSMGKCLQNFNKWRKEMLLPRLAHDNAYLFSAIDFDGVTVGLAHIGVMCNEQYSAGVVQHPPSPLHVPSFLLTEPTLSSPMSSSYSQLPTSPPSCPQQDFTKSAAAVGATFVHEISHNLGVNHDNANCSCSSLTCIMSPYVGSPIPNTFSQCSLDQFKTFLMTKVPTCLLNEPNKKTSMAPPVCGNHFVEMGEQCDCGTEQECTNPCCDALTCNLKAGAVCSDGECCEKCQIKKEGSVCRLSLHDCDLPDKCDGKSNLCLDLFKKDGASCMNGQGYCLHGKCPTLANQCTALWGSGRADYVKVSLNYIQIFSFPRFSYLLPHNYV
ncbi:PREDICTED: zinc metalloproteinase-disintegrin-like crotastatin, partial [Nanorana parkeri]|uniref:zinc metalloproteinase-disintegrin-like crotastatin n=1 Tax=Nanorana parkeri TaxID=125878 RepID=UPI0008542821